MATNIESLRIPLAEDRNGAAGAYGFGGLFDYAPVADRRASTNPVPERYALFADAAASESPLPGFTLFAEKKTAIARKQSRTAILIALGIALLLHLALVTLFIAWPGAPEKLGIEEGVPDLLNVSVISEADLKRLSSDPFRQMPQPSQEAVQEQPAPPQEQSDTAQTAWKTEAQEEKREEKKAEAQTEKKIEKSRDIPFDPAGYAAAAAEHFSSQLKQALNAPRPERREETKQEGKKKLALASRNVRLMRPSASRSGKSDEFAKGVIWALGATKPMGNGKFGSTIVTFTVSESGKVEGLRLIKSSGDNWLDQGALLAVRQARMPVPPSSLSAGDRTFNVEYISLPDGH